MTLRQRTIAIQKLVGAKPDGIYGPNTAARILHSLESNNVDDSKQAGPTFEGEFDPRTVKNLNTLESGAKEKLIPFLREAFAIAQGMGVEAKVICGLRGKKAQEAAKARGASKAGWGYSWHNFGMAIDLGLFLGRKYLDSADPRLANTVYKAIGAIAAKHGIEWGGSWRRFKDTPHFHVNIGRSTPNANDRRLLFSGQWSF